MRVYIPTWYGDVQVTRSKENPQKESVLKTSDLSMEEIALVKSLLKKFKVAEPKKYAPAEITIPSPLEKVHAQTKLLLKKGKPTITAIRLSDGLLEEVQNLEAADKRLAEEGIKEEDRKAVTTPVPTRGCPMPVFDALRAREIRATNVLKEFLNPTQARDFDRHSAFVVVGGRTGNLYRVAHRHSHIAAEEGIVRDLHQNCSICTHQTDMPPAEEMLSLLVALSCPTTELDWINSHG